MPDGSSALDQLIRISSGEPKLVKNLTIEDWYEIGEMFVDISRRAARLLKGEDDHDRRNARPEYRVGRDLLIVKLRRGVVVDGVCAAHHRGKLVIIFADTARDSPDSFSR